MLILPGGICAAPPPVRCTRTFLKAAEEIFFEARKPLVKRLARNAKVPRGERYVLPVLLPEDDPFEPSACRAGETLQFGDLAPALMLGAEPVPAPTEPMVRVDQTQPRHRPSASFVMFPVKFMGCDEIWFSGRRLRPGFP